MTLLEKYINHPNFLELKETSTQFEIVLKSVKWHSLWGEDYYTVETDAIVENETYSIHISKEHAYKEELNARMDELKRLANLNRKEIADA